MYGIAAILLLLAAFVNSEVLPDCPTDFCGGKKDDDYKNPPEYDQTHFVTCSNELTYCRDCPAELKFNGVTKRCGNYTHIPDDPNCPSDKFCVEMIDGNYANPKEYPQNYYVNCMNGFVCCMKCNEGFVFDGERGICTKGETPTVKPKTTAKPNSTPADEPKRCPANFCVEKLDGNYANPASPDQRTYISCSGQVTYCMDCSADLVYNADLGVCVEPTTDGEKTTPANEPTDSISTPTPTYSTSTKPSEKCPSSFCVAKLDGNYANPASPDQRTYISCSGQVTYCMDCSANLVYNSDLGVCVAPSTDGEITTPANEPTPTDSTPPSEKCPVEFCSEKPDGDYPNPSSTNHHTYISCSGKVTYCRNCPDSLVYNAEAKQCLPSTGRPHSTRSHSTTRSPPSCPVEFCSEKSDGDYANPSSSNHHTYISCSGKVTYCRNCPDNLVYNAEAKQCLPSTGRPYSTRSHSTTRSPPSCPTNFCSGKKDGDYANPASSNGATYVSCSGGVTYCRPCPAHLYYDKATKRCQPRTGGHTDCPSNFCRGKPDGEYADPRSSNGATYFSCALGFTVCRKCPQNLYYNADAKRCQPRTGGPFPGPCISNHHIGGVVSSVTTQTTTTSTTTSTTTNYVPMSDAWNRLHPLYQTYCKKASDSTFSEEK